MFKKTHYFSNTVHYCRSSMPRLSQTRCFSTKSLLPTSTVCSDWPTDQCIVIGRTPQARVRNVTPLTIIASFSFQVSFTISSKPEGEQSRVTDTVMILVCICSTQAVVKTISDGLYSSAVMWPCSPHTHKRCVTANLRIWTVIAILKL